MKRVQHDEVKPGMTIKLAHHGGRGRWVHIHDVRGLRLSSPHQEASALVTASYLNGRKAGEKFSLAIYVHADGYEVHSQSELHAAQAYQRKGRAGFVQNVVLREYSIKFVAVDRVDNGGVSCGYCNIQPITCNIYATVATDSGRTEESAWSSCDRCCLRSIDTVEDVDSSYTITIERAQ